MTLPGFAIAAPSAEPLANFPAAQEAQERCPDDLIVWLDVPTRTYHYRGQHWYGATESGAVIPWRHVADFGYLERPSIRGGSRHEGGHA